jgi:uncharacterized membrane protein
MRAKVVVAGHSLHAMLIVFPLGLLTTSVVWDICRLASHRRTWGVISFWTIVAGLVGALLAAVPGFIDWLSIPADSRAKKIGLYHMVLNLIVVGLFIASLAARWATPGGYADAGFGRMVWGWIGVAIAVVSSWLGGELVERLGIGVNEDANPDAPSSLAPAGRTRAAGRNSPLRPEG